MTKDEALKMAIEEMNIYAYMYLCEHQCEDEELLDVINACKEALEQPAQDYVLICKRCGDDLGIEYVPDEQPAQECKWCKSSEVNFDDDVDLGKAYEWKHGAGGTL
jgi:hypothetical protein